MDKWERGLLLSVCFFFDYLTAHILNHSFFLFPVAILPSFFISIHKIVFICIHSFLFFFFLSLSASFFQTSMFSDYRVDGLAKASSIIAFEQRCSLAMCSSETRPFSICRPVSCKYRTALSSQLRWTFTDNTRLFQTHHRSILLSVLNISFPWF